MLSCCVWRQLRVLLTCIRATFLLKRCLRETSNRVSIAATKRCLRTVEKETQQVWENLDDTGFHKRETWSSTRCWAHCYGNCISLWQNRHTECNGLLKYDKGNTRALSLSGMVRISRFVTTSVSMEDHAFWGWLPWKLTHFEVRYHVGFHGSWFCLQSGPSTSWRRCWTWRCAGPSGPRSSASTTTWSSRRTTSTKPSTPWYVFHTGVAGWKKRNTDRQADYTDTHTRTHARTHARHQLVNLRIVASKHTSMNVCCKHALMSMHGNDKNTHPESDTQTIKSQRPMKKYSVECGRGHRNLINNLVLSLFSLIRISRCSRSWSTATRKASRSSASSSVSTSSPTRRILGYVLVSSRKAKETTIKQSNKAQPTLDAQTQMQANGTYCCECVHNGCKQH